MGAVAELAASAELIAGMGHNQPPESPFEAIKVHIEDLYLEARNWLDGEPITTQAQADEVGRLLDLIREAEKAAEEARKTENKPFDEGKAAVQAKYAPLTADTKAVRGKTVLAAEACKAALAPWRQEQERIKREAAEKARAEAEAAAQAARDAAASAAANDLDAREAAETAMRQAEQAQKVAARADKAASTGTGLRSYWSPTLTDGVVAARHYWTVNREGMEAALLELAKADVHTGKRTIPGFDVTEERRAF
jgi:type IV secretory pathway VirB10-like protein